LLEEVYPTGLNGLVGEAVIIVDLSVWNGCTHVGLKGGGQPSTLHDPLVRERAMKKMPRR
jgi:hypothetical protein